MNSGEAFDAARELLGSDPANLTAMLAMQVGPTTKGPAGERCRRVVRGAAGELLSPAPSECSSLNSQDSLFDSVETEKLVRTGRVPNQNRTAQRTELEQIAREALAWAAAASSEPRF